MSDAVKDALTPAVLADLAAHAAEAYPSECCGFVLSDGTVHRATNIQDELSAAQPGRYDRTASNGYTMSVPDTIRLNASFSEPNPAVILYHSHPDVGAYFSAEDRDKALFAGTPVSPVDYLVLDTRPDGTREAKLFAWDGFDFACVATYPLTTSALECLQGGLLPDGAKSYAKLFSATCTPL